MQKTFDTPEPVRLEITVPVGEVDVQTVDGNESEVIVEGSEKLVEQTRVELVGNRLVIETREKAFGVTISIGGFVLGGNDLDIRVRVPHASSADIKTASADMRLRGRYARLDSKSASGDLEVIGEIDGDAEVKTVSGDVRLRSVGGSLKVQSVSGDVNVESVANDVTTKSVSGDVRIDSAREGKVTAQSVSGDIELGVASGTNLDVDAGSVSGELSSDVPLGSDVASIDSTGPVLVVRGKTVSGDFKVFRAA
ncbi:MAG TPA: DUF4097 family beta strand repeat-containing protein [Gaiellaceae bacterium]|nr:DUF4097 family beta strand repeat-containing protein [Gaiellaceae bacterium]